MLLCDEIHICSAAELNSNVKVPELEKFVSGHMQASEELLEDPGGSWRIRRILEGPGGSWGVLPGSWRILEDPENPGGSWGVLGDPGGSRES